MRRCVVFFATALALGGLTARADYLYVKIDLSQVYQNIPSMPAGAFAAPGAAAGPGPQIGRIGPGGPGGPGVRPPIGRGPMPMPIPMPGGAPMRPPGPGEGPFVYATIEMRPKPIGSKEPIYSFDHAAKDPDGVKNGAHHFDHVWGKSGRFVDTPTLTPGIIKYIKINKESLAREYDRTFKKELAASKDPRKFIHAATWALQHGWSRKETESGLMKEFHAAMEELRKLDAKHPIVANYLRVQAALKKPPTADDPAAKSLMTELSGKYHTVAGSSGFYVALTNQFQNFDGDTKRRLNRLQETMESFYYWFALNDQLPQPALPRYRQLLIVTSSVEEFYAKHALWGSPVFAGDGLTPRRDNIILMSSRPVDDVFRVFSGNNQELWKKLQLKPDVLLKGTVWDAGGIPEAFALDLFNVAFTQTLTIVQKAIEDESELATLSREGTRQLLFASGILPRQVHTPEWIAEGLASYFETSPGAPYRGIGLPSWSNLVAFKYFRIAKKLDKHADVLANVVTDRYFRNTQKLLGELVELGDNDNKLSEQLREELELANSTAWAFAYYMIERRRQPQLLLRYCQELNALPRDLDLDDRAMEACFAKVFDMADPSNPSRVDTAKFAALADAWFAEMSGVSLEVPEVQNEYLEIRKLAATKKPAAN